jgi:uncharacterized protein YceK
MKKKLLLVTLILPLFTGCATIMTGSTQKINVSSAGIPHVTFKIDDTTYTTPTTVTVKRENEDKVIVVEDEACVQKRIVLNKKLNPMFLGNLLSGGMFGSTTDYFTGAMWQYDDNVVIQCK